MRIANSSIAPVRAVRAAGGSTSALVRRLAAVNTSHKGNSFDVRVAEALQDQGWTVGSRRHISGPGDLLATKPGERGRLIECKRGAGSPYENFRREARHALRDYAADNDLVPELAWRKDRGQLEFIDEASWP